MGQIFSPETKKGTTSAESATTKIRRVGGATNTTALAYVSCASALIKLVGGPASHIMTAVWIATTHDRLWSCYSASVVLICVEIGWYER